MKTDLFDYVLPDELIAKYPPKKRDGGRLLVLDPKTGGMDHRRISDLTEILPEGALLVANNTRVIKARLRGKRPTGGAVEVLLVRMIRSGESECEWRVLGSANKPLRVGDPIRMGDLRAQVTAKGEGGALTLYFDRASSEVLAFSEQYGEVPLPPYLKRSAEPEDHGRYQTVYAAHDGSVAAPTAGLHFTDDLILALRQSGIEMVHITLHVGPGTFKPVTSEYIADHEMESEVYGLDESVVQSIRCAKTEGRPVVAVGTTATRALEGAFAALGELRSGAGETDLFIAPGFAFHVIDGLITNFHLPRSTLICLVSALAGRENVLTAYEEAVTQRYRFYSYGDAMLVMPRKGVVE